MDTSGISRFDGFGIRTFAGVGDVNGDGLDDIAVGSLWASARDFVTVGNFSVLSAETAAASESRVEARLLYRTDGSDSLLEGFSFSTTGDFDGDGNGEFLVGRDPRVFAGSGLADQGRHLLHEIGDNGITPGASLFTMGGSETDFVGDINGDGFDDLFVTVPTGHSILLGNAEGAVDRAVVLAGETGIGAFTLGRATSGGGDLNGDGFGDFATLIRNQSAVRAIHGRAELSGIDLGGGENGFRLALPGAATNVEILSDFDGDGTSDLLVSWRGGAAVLLDTAALEGTLSLADLDASRRILIESTGFNDLARAVGDINGDGREDINFSQRLPDGSVNVGVLFGSGQLPGNVGLADLDGVNGFVISGARAGKSVGDVNGDGIDDMMLRTDRGTGSAMTILFGRPSPPLDEGAPPDKAAPVDAPGETLRGTAEDDVIHGGLTDDYIAGERGDDSLYGGDGDDTLRGGRANDMLSGGAGADVLNGGEGEDTVDFGDSGGGVFIRLMISKGLGGEAAGDEIRFVEHADGSAFDDRLYGSDSDNVLNGGGGNDRLQGHHGNDMLQGGAGDDTLVGGDGDDTIFGGDGDDTLRGGADTDLLRGGSGRDHIDGGTGNDTLFGGEGADRLYGQDGADRLFGEAGDDVLIDGGGDDLLEGGDGNDVLRGNAGDDRLFGGLGHDFISGGTGADLLNGGAGDDTLAGGPGSDLFVFTRNSGLDTVTDFDQGDGDRLDLTAFGLTPGAISLIRSGDNLIVSGDSFEVVLLNTPPESFRIEDTALF
ncbi:calcium-binding protein [Minwuia thermotolerans]|uniref:Calcium-binding protein n=1 Tax=Minwuia thermotolerans TaxID=2056226 RepID=A0A2M9G6U9_9PROT|nr:calcium-binding protein [Minwuia thermotolerans]PJK31449.1 hypothetical protein CVT23_01895 [Minwuia thermotolerans]